MVKVWTSGNSGAGPWTTFLRGIIDTCGWLTGWGNRGGRAPSSLETGSLREGKVKGRRQSICSAWENRRKDLAEKGEMLEWEVSWPRGIPHSATLEAGTVSYLFS